MTDSPELTAIRDVVSKHLRDRGAITDETPLVSGGLIDSMSLVDLILDLQAALGVTIPTSEVQPDDFDSVVAIATTVARFR